MSEEGRFEIPKDMRAMAEASFDQARKAFEKFVATAQTTAGTIEERDATVASGAKDIGAKAISYAEKNVQASLDYAQSLLHAKDLTEVMKLHSEYVQAQMRSLAEQVRRLEKKVERDAKKVLRLKAKEEKAVRVAAKKEAAKAKKGDEEESGETESLEDEIAPPSPDAAGDEEKAETDG